MWSSGRSTGQLRTLLLRTGNMFSCRRSCCCSCRCSRRIRFPHPFAQVARQPVQHPPDLDRLGGKRVEIGEGKDPEIPCGDEMVLQFRRGRRGYAHEPAKFPSASMPGSLDDVGRNRHRRPEHLTAQREVVPPPHPHHGAMHVESQRVTLPPNLEFLEIAHARRWRNSTEAPTSIHFANHRILLRQFVL